MITSIFNSRSLKHVTAVSKICTECINWFINFNLIIYFLVFTRDSRDSPFIFLGYHFFALPFKLLFSSYSHLILFWRQRFIRTAALHRLQSYSIQKWAHIPNLCKASTHSVYQLAPYPALNVITFLDRRCSVKDFTEGPRLTTSSHLWLSPLQLHKVSK